MDESEIEYHISQSLRETFDRGDRDKKIAMYKVAYQLSYYEMAKEMASDVLSDYNLKID